MGGHMFHMGIPNVPQPTTRFFSAALLGKCWVDVEIQAEDGVWRYSADKQILFVLHDFEVSSLEQLSFAQFP